MQKNRRLTFLVMLPPSVVMTLAAAFAWPADESSPDEIVVTATRIAQKLSDVPESVSVISATQIADTPAQTIDDVLRLVPGINLALASGTQIHPTVDYVAMRGLSGNRALVLLDGI